MADIRSAAPKGAIFGVITRNNDETTNRIAAAGQES
jgi:hypothetical protein